MVTKINEDDKRQKIREMINHAGKGLWVGKKGFAWEAIGKILLILIVFIALLVIFMLLSNKTFELLGKFFG